MSLDDDWGQGDVADLTKEQVLYRLQKLEELKVSQQQVTEKEAAAQRKQYKLEPHQQPPDGDWRIWLLNAGRGSGKSFASAYWLDEHVNGPPCDDRIPGGHQVLIVAPTMGDAVESCIEGPSGLKSINGGIRLVHGVGGSHVIWPNGTRGRLLGAHNPEDVERLRGSGNRCAAWLEELAAWVRLEGCLDNLLLGLRVGDKPRAVASTTPKPRKRLKELMSDPRTVVTSATTFDNPHLDDDTKDDLRRRYEGTRVGRQELFGEFLEDVEGALWSWEMIEKAQGNVPIVETSSGWEKDLLQIAIGIDPGFARGGDDTGIILGGIDRNLHGWVLGDFSGKMTPDEWGRLAVKALRDNEGNHVVIESNLGGGEFTKNVIHTVDQRVRVKVVRASRGKAVRAEPIVSLYEQGRIHHDKSANLSKMEEELTLWTPLSGFSPGRLDALVWLFTDLMVEDMPSQAKTSRERTRGRVLA